jgi:hypothetical protein
MRKEIVSCKKKDYVVYEYSYKDKNELFIIDAEDAELIEECSWRWKRRGETALITSKSRSEGVSLSVFLMQEEVETDDDKIIYISGNTRDNRRCNLKISKLIKLGKQGVHKRTLQLPEDCGIDIGEVPKCVKYHAARPAKRMGDYFSFSLQEGGKIHENKSSCSLGITLREKLNEIIGKLKLLDDDILERHHIFDDQTEKEKKLNTEFNEIILVSHFESKYDNLIVLN